MYSIDRLAEQYVRLSLQIGLHCPNFVDAYYGPKEWLPIESKLPLDSIKISLKEAIVRAGELPKEETRQQERRFELLLIQIKAAVVYVDMLQGNFLSFSKECDSLYDAKPLAQPAEDFDKVLIELEELLPGTGELNSRLNRYREGFAIPVGKLERVFSAAINEARRRTLLHIDLPANESFEVELVTDQVWSAYNWYKGNSFSLIELNTDFPIQIERAIDLAAHEGYPGHHVFNALMEKHLVNKNRWMEYSIYNLFSPISLLAEGSANYGIEVAFPWQERLVFEKEVLFPLAGIDPSLCDKYYQIQQVLHKLSYSDNMIAQRFLDGEIDESAAIELLMKYGLNSPEKARQRLSFIKQNRAYVITYNYGQDLVKCYLQSQLKRFDHNELWAVFAELLANPRSGSMMK